MISVSDQIIERLPIFITEYGSYDLELTRPIEIKNGDYFNLEGTNDNVNICSYIGDDEEKVPSEVEICFFIGRKDGKVKKHWRYGTLTKKED